MKQTNLGLKIDNLKVFIQYEQLKLFVGVSLILVPSFITVHVFFENLIKIHKLIENKLTTVWFYFKPKLLP